MPLELKPFQKDSVKYSIKFLTTNPARAVYDGSDPGTGKTISTYATLEEMQFKRVLIIVPKVMLLTWKEQGIKWTKYRNIEVIQGLKDILKIYTAHVCIVSYSSCWRSELAKVLKSRTWDCLVLDESQKVKDETTEQGKFILKELWPKIPYKIALSGTPFTTCVTDCHSLFSRMMIDDSGKSPFGSWLEFAETFANPKYTPYGTKWYGIQNSELLSKLIRKHFFFRHRREEVLPELPKRIFQKIVLPKRYSHKEYEKMLEDLEAEGTNVWELPDIPTHMMGLLNLQGELKVDPIVEYVSDLLEQDVPVILFTLNRSVLSLYMEKLQAFSPVKIDGASTDKEKNNSRKAFQDGGTNLCIVNIKAAGLGIDLFRAKYVVFAQLPFNPSDVEQGISRANRMGATEVTNISYFVVEKSLDEKISSMIVSKTKDFDNLFNREKL